MSLKFNEYHLYKTQPYSVVFWVNRNEILYQWDFDAQDMVQSSLNIENLRSLQCIKTSTNLRELVKISQKEKNVFEIKRTLKIPYYIYKYVISSLRMKWREKL